MSNIVPFNDLQGMARAMAQSGLFGMKTPDQALGLMLVAQAEGQHPATIAQDYDIIQGRAARKTHSVLARFQQAGGRVEWHDLTEKKADATFSHPAGGSLRMTWTFDQAQRAGLTGKDNWKNYPRAMLRARCIAEGVRAVYPAALGGMLVSEEAQDMPPTQAVESEPVPTFDLDAAVSAVNAAATAEDVQAAWKTHLELARNAQDKAGYDALKAAVSKKLEALRNPPTDVEPKEPKAEQTGE